MLFSYIPVYYLLLFSRRAKCYITLHYSETATSLSQDKKDILQVFRMSDVRCLTLIFVLVPKHVNLCHMIYLFVRVFAKFWQQSTLFHLTPGDRE